MNGFEINQSINLHKKDGEKVVWKGNEKSHEIINVWADLNLFDLAVCFQNNFS